MKTALAQLPSYQLCRAFSAFDFSATKKQSLVISYEHRPGEKKPELESFSWARRARLSEQVETSGMHEADITKNTAIVSITKSDVESITRQVPALSAPVENEGNR